MTPVASMPAVIAPMVAGPSLGMAVLALAIAVAFVRHRAGLGLLVGAVAFTWAIRWVFNAPLEVLGPLAVGVDGPGLTVALAAVGACAIGQGRGRSGLAATLLAACLIVDVRLGLIALGLAWTAAAWIHAGPRRTIIGATLIALALLGLLWLASQLGIGRLDALPPIRSTPQVVILGVYAGLLIPALLLPGAARSAGLLGWTWGLMRFVAPLCPETLQLITPGLRWLAITVAILGAVLMVRGRRIAPIALVTMAGAVLALGTRAELGITAAALLLASGALGVALVRLDTRLGGVIAFLSPALIVGLSAATYATWTAVGPVAVGPWVTGVVGAAGVCLLAVLWAPRREIERPRSLLFGAALSVCLGVAPLLGGPLPGASTVAAQAGRRAIPPDDRLGWRRVQWLESFRKAPADAGVP
ncbi:MAG: hypothetical protein ACI9U2_004919 [Bradymonadia bacterium]|jgi:hypothetical protein